MSMILNQVRRGYFLDSVALMRISRTVAGLDGVEEAALMMGSPSNLGIMCDADLLDEVGRAAAGGDLILAVRAADQAAGEAALAKASDLLERRPSAAGAGNTWRSKTLRSAVKHLPGANLALISVPGDFAAAEARKALRAGLHAMIFSDNVSIKDELDLKQEARAAGLLVMGPDCGTAIIGGVPLAFANVVPRGDIGIIGASGTGIQEISCLIAQAGGGVSHAIGVGGRDLKAEIGGITTLMAIDALACDPATRHVVLISKPPAAEVARRVLERIGASPKSYTVCFIGAEELDLPANARAASTLKAAALDAMQINALLGTVHTVTVPDARAGSIQGLFCGGTLAAEAQVIFRAAGLAVASNAPIPGIEPLAGSTALHRLIDLGEDEYTAGRPHPMIEPAVRDDVLAETLRDPDVAVVLLDVVIGLGADEDPAGHVAREVAGRGAGGPIVIASVTGTDGDPQGRLAQIEKLRAAGIHVAASNADAAELAVACIGAGA